MAVVMDEFNKALEFKMQYKLQKGNIDEEEEKEKQREPEEDQEK